MATKTLPRSVLPQNPPFFPKTFPNRCWTGPSHLTTSPITSSRPLLAPHWFFFAPAPAHGGKGGIDWGRTRELGFQRGLQEHLQLQDGGGKGDRRYAAPPSGANPLCGRKQGARQGAQLATPKPHSHHLPRYNRGGTFPQKNRPRRGGQGQLGPEGVRGDAGPPGPCRGMPAAPGAGSQAAGEPQPHEIMKCQSEPCIFHSLSGHLPD